MAESWNVGWVLVFRLWRRTYFIIPKGMIPNAGATTKQQPRKNPACFFYQLSGREKGTDVAPRRWLGATSVNSIPAWVGNAYALRCSLAKDVR